jgi:seryl-tRNA synthetase
MRIRWPFILRRTHEDIFERRLREHHRELGGLHDKLNRATEHERWLAAESHRAHETFTLLARQRDDAIIERDGARAERDALAAEVGRLKAESNALRGLAKRDAADNCRLETQVQRLKSQRDDLLVKIGNALGEFAANG